jgi:hypothetical protein
MTVCPARQPGQSSEPATVHSVAGSRRFGRSCRQRHRPCALLRCLDEIALHRFQHPARAIFSSADLQRRLPAGRCQLWEIVVTPKAHHREATKLFSNLALWDKNINFFRHSRFLLKTKKARNDRDSAATGFRGRARRETPARRIPQTHTKFVHEQRASQPSRDAEIITGSYRLRSGVTFAAWPETSPSM